MNRTMCLTLLAACLFPCATFAQDAGVKIVEEGGIKAAWDLAPGTRLKAPGYPEEAKGSGDNVCIALGYRIQPDGRTSDFVVLHNWTNNVKAANQNVEYLDPYARAASVAVSEWRFAPKGGVQAAPVDTVATIGFKGSTRGESVAGIRQHCRIPDLVAAYAARRDSVAGEQDMIRARLDKMYLEASRAERRAASEKRALGSGAYHPNASSKGY